MSGNGLSVLPNLLTIAHDYPVIFALACAGLYTVTEFVVGGFDLPPKNSARENWSSLVI
jgi:hypothetical protein